MAAFNPGYSRGSTLKKYSLKRSINEQEKPPEKRQRVEEAITETARPKLKRTIKDYFGSTPSTASSSSLIPSSSPSRERSTPPSSPGHLTEDPAWEQEKGSKRRRLTTYSNAASKLPKMSPKNGEEFHVGSPKPVSFLRDTPPSLESRQGLLQTRIVESRRERRGESNLHGTLATLVGSKDLLADVVDRNSDSSFDIEKYDTMEVTRPGAIDFPPPRMSVLKFQRRADSDNPISSPLQTMPETDRIRAINALNTLTGRPNITVLSIIPNMGSLVQTQINLGGQTNVTCQICRFSYNPTLSSDRNFHDEYHQNFDKGLSINGLKPLSTLNVKKLLSHINPDGGENFIVMVHRRSSLSWKNIATTVLAENVDRDLGSEAITENELWSAIPLPVLQSSSVDNQGLSSLPEQLVDRFKVYMYVKHFGRGKPSRVIAVLLAERIIRGFSSHIKESDKDPMGCHACLIEDAFGLLKCRPYKALLGVNKIWVNKRYRRWGLATTLFDTAREDFIFGHPISRQEVAWTHPTEEGAKFAKKCLKGKADCDFLSYTDK